jgi:hypothetical protein
MFKIHAFQIRVIGFLTTVAFLLPMATSAQTAKVSAKTTKSYTLANLLAERKIAAAKKRRIIFNNDGNESFGQAKTVSKDGLLSPRSYGLENSQVDAIYYCTSHAWGNFNHDSKTGTILRLKEEKGKETLFKNNLTGEFIDAGLDPLKVMVEFGHSAKKEVFWSMRMNDTHDGGQTKYGPVLFGANKIKTAHPEYLVGSQFEKGSGSWSAANYGLKVVRDYTYTFIEEVCQNYDVDGIELDFFRHRVFFKSTFKGQNALPEEVAAMTDLMRRIRKMTEAEGLKRKRPILLSMRVPDSKEYALAIGLDIENWLKEGLLDIMSVSSYIRLKPWEESVKLGHQYGVQVYPSLDESRISDKVSESLRSSDLSYRAQAAEAWAAGVDGIYMFNFFNPKSRLWSEIGDPAALAKLDKDYFASVRGIGKNAAVPHKSYVKVPILNPDSPIKISKDKKGSVELRIGKEDLSTQTATLALRFKDTLADAKNLEVQLNGHTLDLSGTEKDWLLFKLKSGAPLKQINAISCSVKSAPEKPLVWTDLMLSIRAK